MATSTRPVIAPTRPALRAEAAWGACVAGAWGWPAARLATTGGRDGRVRFGSGVPAADESNEGSAAGGGTATAEAAARGPGGAGGEDDDRGMSAAEDAASSPRRRTTGPGRVAGTINAAAPLSVRVALGGGGGGRDASGARGGGKGAGAALGPPILRSTSRRAG